MSEAKQMSPDQARALLAEPVKLEFSGRTVLNRFVKGAMTERMCTWSADDPGARGKPTPEYTRLYERWAASGLGINIFGNVHISTTLLEGEGNAICCKKSTWDAVEAFKPAITATKKGGSLAIIQINHPGRQCSDRFTKEPLGPAASGPFDAMGCHFKPARALTVEEIEDIVERFAYAAEVMYKAGADGVQLHAAHGYLLSQFLSPDVNRRDDRYGGDIINRSRIIFEIFDRIKQKINDPKFVLSIKINSADYHADGFEPEECIKVVEMLEEAKVDLIELSGGVYESLAFEHLKESTKKREAFFLEFASRIVPHVKKSRVVVTGGFRTLGPMANAVAEKLTDFIGVGRPLSAEPTFPADILSGKITAAKPTELPMTLSIMGSICQNFSLGKGLDPDDLSTPDAAATVMKFMESWTF